jgi:hypothetical protein
MSKNSISGFIEFLFYGNDVIQEEILREFTSEERSALLAVPASSSLEDLER